MDFKPMSQMIDISELLTPISEEMPCGENLEYDRQFVELELVATPKAERAMGDSVKAAEEPDWSQVEKRSEELLGRSKDLRTAILLTSAWLRTQGLPGWASGLALVQGLLENYWDDVHPQLDAEDDNDPTARVNSVSVLTDPIGILGYFRNTTFVRSPRLGQFSLRSLRIANGTLQTNTGNSPTLVEIEACCMDCPEQELVEALAAITDALEHANVIDRIFYDRVGTAGPDLKPLLQDHRDLAKFIHAQVALRIPSFGTDSPDTDSSDLNSPTEMGDKGLVGPAEPGQITSLQDVKRLLDAICEYYAKHEPSSPVPLLLRRAQRLVGANFMDLLKDLAPSGLSEIQMFSGSEN
jgi:type VI secretion system protein ImpA